MKSLYAATEYKFDSWYALLVIMGHLLSSSTPDVDASLVIASRCWSAMVTSKSKVMSRQFGAVCKQTTNYKLQRSMFTKWIPMSFDAFRTLGVIIFFYVFVVKLFQVILETEQVLGVRSTLLVVKVISEKLGVKVKFVIFARLWTCSISRFCRDWLDCSPFVVAVVSG